MSTVLLYGRQRVRILGPKPTVAKSLRSATRPPIIAVDFDNTLVQTDATGAISPVVGASEVMRILRDEGWYIIVHTCRSDKQKIQQVLSFFNIPYHQINEQSPFAPDGVSSKPMADVYVDDRAIKFNGDWDTALREIETAQTWRKSVNSERLGHILEAVFVRGLKLSGVPEKVPQQKAVTKKTGLAGKPIYDYPEKGSEKVPRLRDARRRALRKQETPAG